MPVADIARTYQKDCIDFLQRLVRTRSVNGADNEAGIVQVIADEAEKLGLPYQVIAKDNARPNIFVGQDFAGKDAVLLVAHLDTAPTGDESAWQHPPFGAMIKDNKLYGRGAIDCKGGIAISLYVLKILADAGKLHLAKFVGVADEESGADSTLGLMHLLKSGLNAKEAVYTYGGESGHHRLTIGHRGLIRLWVTCHGESAHSGSREWQDGQRGANAITGITELLNALQDFTMPGENKYFPGYHFVLTPTIVTGGSGESIVPDHAKVLLDIRTLPEHNNQAIIDKITHIADRLATKKRHYNIAVKNNIPGALTDPDSSIVKRALKLNNEIWGIDSILSGSGPANEGYMLVKHGIPTITGYGPHGGNFHAVDEYAELDSIEPLLNLLTRLICRPKV